MYVRQPFFSYDESIMRKIWYNIESLEKQTFNATIIFLIYCLVGLYILIIRMAHRDANFHVSIFLSRALSKNGRWQTDYRVFSILKFLQFQKIARWWCALMLRGLLFFLILIPWASWGSGCLFFNSLYDGSFNYCIRAKN